MIYFTSLLYNLASVKSAPLKQEIWPTAQANGISQLTNQQWAII